jgi:hypothetical protein
VWLKYCPNVVWLNALVRSPHRHGGFTTISTLFMKSFNAWVDVLPVVYAYLCKEWYKWWQWPTTIFLELRTTHQILKRIKDQGTTYKQDSGSWISELLKSRREVARWQGKPLTDAASWGCWRGIEVGVVVKAVIRWNSNVEIVWHLAGYRYRRSAQANKGWRRLRNSRWRNTNRSDRVLWVTKEMRGDEERHR